MTKKPDAWMPLYIGDWDSGTGHLSCEEDGAYGRLIRWYWRNGPLPDDDLALSRVVRTDLRTWRKLRPSLAKFFKIDNGFWFNKRADEELARWTAKKAKAVEKAQIAAAARYGNPRPKAASSTPSSTASSNQQALLEHCPSPSSSKVRAYQEALTLTVRLGAGERAKGGLPPPRAWNGPEEITKIVVDRMGEAYAASWLFPCSWQDVPERVILAPTGFCADRLWKDFQAELTEREISIGKRKAA